MHRRAYPWQWLAAILASLLAAGCGSRGGEGLIQVKGKLTNAGQPLKVQGQEAGLGLIQLEFYRITESGQPSTDPESARLDEQGNFTIPGRSGGGILPGKYRVVVRQWDPYPNVDRLGGKFDAAHSPIVRQIAGQEDVVIDVSQPKG